MHDTTLQAAVRAAALRADRKHSTASRHLNADNVCKTPDKKLQREIQRCQTAVSGYVTCSSICTACFHRLASLQACSAAA